MTAQYPHVGMGMESVIPYPLCVCTVLAAGRAENEDDPFI